MTPQSTVFDSSEMLATEEALRAYLDATCEDGSAAEIAYALGVVAKSRSMTKLAEQTGLTRQALYKALSGEGNPEFATVLKVAEALGLRIAFHPSDASSNDRDAA